MGNGKGISRGFGVHSFPNEGYLINMIIIAPIKMIQICLFYDNPRAGSIYRALGFEDVGMWTMIKQIEF